MKHSPSPYPLRRLSEAYTAFANSREKGLIGRQRLAVYFYSSMIIAVGIPLNLTGLTGPETPVYAMLNSVHLLLTLGLFAAYWRRKISLTGTLGALLLVTQAEISAEMIFSALNPSDYRMMLQVSDMILSAVVIMLALVAYLRHVPLLICGAALGTYLICVLITESPSMRNFALLFILIFSLITLLGNRLVRNVRELELENEVLREEEHAMLELLQLNKKQIFAIAELAKGEADEIRAGELFNAIGKKAKQNLYRSVRWQMTQEHTASGIIERAFPELTPSEREICRLILQGKKLDEMCQTLGKTRGNITSQRTHIREKLGLNRKDDLKSVLQKRMNKLNLKTASTPERMNYPTE